jgi:hypothetical protein
VRERVQRFMRETCWVRRSVLVLTFPLVVVLQVGEFTIRGFLDGCKDVAYWYGEIRRDFW